MGSSDKVATPLVSSPLVAENAGKKGTALEPIKIVNTEIDRKIRKNFVLLCAFKTLKKLFRNLGLFSSNLY